MTIEQLEQQIADYSKQLEEAYAKFERFGNPSDRDAAIQLLHTRDAAILARSESAQRERHAAFERSLDEGVDYFSWIAGQHSKGSYAGNHG